MTKRQWTTKRKHADKRWLLFLKDLQEADDYGSVDVAWARLTDDMVKILGVPNASELVRMWKEGM